jgi:hypothetical protein
LGLVDLEPKIVSIELPGEEKKEEPKKKPATVKKAAAKNQKVDSTQIQLLLVTVSALIASRPGLELWNLTADEAKQLATPLSNILSKNEALANMSNEHADSVALIAACFMIFVPKLLIYYSTKPKKPKEGEKINYGIERPTKSQQQERETKGNTGPNAGQRTSAPANINQNFGSQLHELISPISGF